MHPEPESRAFVIADARGYFPDWAPTFGVEEWRGVVEFDAAGDLIDWSDLYRVSNRSRVLSLRSGELMRPGIQTGGYRQVALTREGRTVCRLVHRLVLFAFIGRPEPGQIALHRNGDKSNNRVEALIWGTYADNRRDADRHAGKSLIGPRFESGAFRRTHHAPAARTTSPGE